jgi:formate/nitrite transporter FocA (FNT family)
MDGGWWSWVSFFIGNLSGAVVMFMILGMMEIGARNDDIKPSVPEKKLEKRRDVH